MEENNSNLFEVPLREEASVGQRLTNYLIDVLIYYAILVILGIVAGMMSPEVFLEEGEGELIWYLVAIITLVAYYTLTEGSSGKTLGKRITRTQVISEDGESISYKTALLRTLCRMVPLEPLSIFFGGGMWHDRWTRTKVVKKIPGI